MQKMRQFLVFATCLTMLSSGAGAHPHVWIEMRSDIVFNDQGLISGINVEWKFDDGYTTAALDGLDADGDGTYSQTEIAPLTKENMASLKDYDYFMVFRQDGKKLAIAEATNAGQIWSNNALELHFFVPLQAPADPKNGEVILKAFDPDFFIGIDLAKDDPVTIAGTMPSACKLAVKPIPTDAELDKTREMLATKGKDWQPENSEDFGAVFAQPISVSC